MSTILKPKVILLHQHCFFLNFKFSSNLITEAVSLPVTAVQMWIIAFKFVRASKVVHKVLGLGTAKNNATQNEVFDKCEFHPHGVRVCYTMFWILLILLKTAAYIRPLLGLTCRGGGGGGGVGTVATHNQT